MVKDTRAKFNQTLVLIMAKLSAGDASLYLVEREERSMKIPAHVRCWECGANLDLIKVDDTFARYGDCPFCGENNDALI